MAEPEGLLVEGARLATIAARDLWWRLAPPRERTLFPLVRIRQRLELFLGALYVGAPAILPADPPPAPTWLARLAGRAPRHLTRQTATAATDGTHIWLPRAVESSEGEARAVDTYRLLAVEMAARADRGTPRHAPPGDPIRSCETCICWPRRSPSTERSPNPFRASGRTSTPRGVRRSTSGPPWIDSPPWSVPSSAWCATSCARSSGRAGATCSS